MNPFEMTVDPDGGSPTIRVKREYVVLTREEDERAAERVREILAENAKLRELAKDLLKNCLESPFWPRDTNSLRIRCQHMGIEVSG